MRSKFLSLCMILFLVVTVASCDEVNEFKIEFETNGGPSIETLIVEKGNTISTQNITREGYTFGGWYIDEDFNELFDFSSIPTKDITLYARWEANQYTISFISNGGSTIEPMTFDYASSVTLPSNATKEGYTFDGWFVDEMLTTEANITNMPNENITLYAKWYREDGLIYINQLTISLSPSRDQETLLQGISYLPDVFKAEMANQGYYIENIYVTIGTSYEQVGEKLVEGLIDIGFLSSMTYAAYSNGSEIEAILAAVRTGLTKDFDNPKDWNDGIATNANIDYMIPYYRSLGIAGISTKGRELADKINNGEEITWDDLQSVKIGVQSPTSSAGRVYPSLLFEDLYDGKSLYDLPSSNIVIVAGYGNALHALASGEVDIAFVYADARRDYADEWILNTNEGGYGRSNSIWEETDVIFVTHGIYNDAIAISKTNVDDQLKLAIQQAFINLANDTTTLSNPTEIFQMVKDIFRIYAHEGYQIINDSDYDYARKALDFLNR